jgi:tetratricopeptide (TPR) repeat protein/transcriptional regulator with XRE-family HTH domain
MLDTLTAWLREQRLARGWSVAEMGRQLQQAAKTTGDHTVPRTAILTSYVRRWEAGKIGLTERYRLHYCTAFGIPPAHFGTGQLHAYSSQPADSAVGAASRDADTARIVTLSDVQVSDDHNAPGRPSGPSGYRWAGQGHNDPETTARAVFAADSPDLLMAMIAEESLDFGEWADTSNTGDAALEHYAAQVRQLASDYQHAAPIPLLLETRRLRDRVFVKLRGHQKPRQTPELYLIAAQVCGLLAWMSGDMSFNRDADAHAWTGWVCAEHADHDGARTWIRATQSKLAYWDGRFAESAQLAEDGLRYECPGSGRVMAALFRARALARLGRDHEAEGALGQARAGMEQAEDDEIGGLWSVIPARFHSLASNIHMWRRDPAQVLAETAQALQQFEVAAPRDRNYGAETHARIDQALAHLSLQDLDGADAALRPVLALASENRYEPITRHLRQAQQALAQPGFRQTIRAQQLQEEIGDYCRESVVNGLTS